METVQEEVFVKMVAGLAWWSNGLDFTLSLQRYWV